MLCGLNAKHRLPTTPLSKHRAPLSCLANQEEYHLFPNPLTPRGKIPCKRGYITDSGDYICSPKDIKRKNSAVITSAEIHAELNQSCENKENGARAALSRLQLIGTKAQIPLEKSTNQLLEKHFSGHIGNVSEIWGKERELQRAYVLDRFLKNHSMLMSPNRDSALENRKSQPSTPSMIINENKNTCVAIVQSSEQQQIGENFPAIEMARSGSVTSSNRGVYPTISAQSLDKPQTTAPPSEGVISAVNSLNSGATTGLINPMENIKSRGHLCLALSSTDSVLQVSIQSAGKLRSNWSSSCNSFVKVQVCPHTRVTHETSVVYGNNSPSYQTDVQIDLSEALLTKRLVISVWHKDTTKNCSEFLGCLSFGVKHLVHKTRHGRAITGAYHILPESMGHRKHILVDNTNENIQPSEPQTPANTTPKSVPTPVSIPTPFRPGAGTISQSRMEETLVEKDEFIRKTLKIHYCGGYGFTVRNTRPVTVGRVKPAGAAYRAGLHSGDVVTKVNGRNLDLLSAEDAALMVRYSKEFVMVEIECPHYRESMKAYYDTYMKPFSNQLVPEPQNVSTNSRLSSACSSNSDNNHSVKRRISANQKPDKRVCGDGEVVNETGFSENHNNNNIGTDVSNAFEESTHDIKSVSGQLLADKLSWPACYNRSVWDPSLSVISGATDLTAYSASYRNESYAEAMTLDRNITLNSSGHSAFSLATEPDSLVTTERRVPRQPDNTMVTDTTDADVTIGTEEGLVWSDDTMTTDHSDPHSYGMENRGFMSEEEILNDSCVLGSDYYTDNDDHVSVAPSSCKNTPRYKTEYRAADDSADSASLAGPRSHLVAALVTEECRFRLQMQHGIRKYLWASRGILHGHEFREIFQNLEKLLAIGSFMEAQMREGLEGGEGGHYNNMCGVYSNKLSLLHEAYSTYFCGLTPALATLDACKLHSLDFQRFLHETWTHEPSMSIDDFLLLPVRHMEAVRAVFEACPGGVAHITQGLNSVCSQIPVIEEFPNSVCAEPTH